MKSGGRGKNAGGDVGRELAQALNARMAAAGVSAIPGARHSHVMELRRGYSEGPRVVWRSNGASVPVLAVPAAMEALLEDSHHFVSQLETLDSAIAQADSLLARMRAANVRSIEAPKGSAFTRIVDTGHARGLQFTWRSNGATCCFRGNIHAASELLRTAGPFHSVLDAQERRQRSLAARGASALDRLRRGHSIGV